MLTEQINFKQKTERRTLTKTWKKVRTIRKHERKLSQQPLEVIIYKCYAKLLMLANKTLRRHNMKC